MAWGNGSGPATDRRRNAVSPVRLALVPGAALAGATVLVAAAESTFHIPDASSIYLLAVVAVAVLGGTWTAVGTAVAAFLLYDLLFVQPHLTLVVADPGEWLNLVLFLVVGVAIGRLTALLGERAEDAARRARENQALFRVSRMLAAAGAVPDALPRLVASLVDETGMDLIWITTGTAPLDSVLADSHPARPRPDAAIQTILQRRPGDQPATWVRAHDPVRRGERGGNREGEIYRIRLDGEGEGEAGGSLWALRRPEHPLPLREETRLLALAADQIGLALRRERLTREANTAELARQADALKTALLESVSHDLRTPLASIRATAGTLADPEVSVSEDDRIAAARAIDAEADRLSGIVRNLLDLSRIEGGALTPDLEIHELAGLVESVVTRLRPLFGDAAITVEVDPRLPPVAVDAVYIDEVLTNLLENAARHAGGSAVRISASVDPSGRLVLRVEDGGPGVAADALPRLFEKFFRGTNPRPDARRGLGIGLSVARGLVEAMGGEVRAGRSARSGGLAIDVILPVAASPPADLARA